MDKKQTWNLGYWLFALLLLLLLQSVWQNANQIEVVSYSEFEKALAEGRIAEVTVADRTLTGRLKAADGRKSVLMATRIETDLASRLDKYDVPYTRLVESTLLRDLMSWLLPALVFFGECRFYILASKDGRRGALRLSSIHLMH